MRVSAAIVNRVGTVCGFNAPHPCRAVFWIGLPPAAAGYRLLSAELQLDSRAAFFISFHREDLVWQHQVELPL